MRVGDILVSVDGKDVVGASLPTALAAIEAARRRVSGLELPCLVLGERPGLMIISRRLTASNTCLLIYSSVVYEFNAYSEGVERGG